MPSQDELLFCAVLSVIALLIVVPHLFSRAYQAIDPPTKLHIAMLYVLHGCLAFLVVTFVTLCVYYPLPPLAAYAPIALVPIIWSGIIGTINVKLMPQSYDEGIERLERRLGH